MFLKINKTWPLYLTGIAANTPNTVNNIQLWQSPPRAENSVMNGASLVIQYLENILYRTTGHLEIDQSDLVKLWERAILLDEAFVDAGELEMASDECPTLHSCMQAAIDLQFVKGCTVQHIRPNVADIKYFIRQYNGVIVQLKATTTTYNITGFTIADVGTVLSEDFNKGFIAHGYSSDVVLLQNSRGVCCGSLGYHKMSWTTFNNLVLDAAVFDVWADRASGKMV